MEERTMGLRINTKHLKLPYAFRRSKDSMWILCTRKTRDYAIERGWDTTTKRSALLENDEAARESLRQQINNHCKGIPGRTPARQRGGVPEPGFFIPKEPDK